MGKSLLKSLVIWKLKVIMRLKGIEMSLVIWKHWLN
jgi:hypothetical protein